MQSFEELAPAYVARRRFTELKWEQLLAALELFQAELEADFEHVFHLGCSYVTGSVARDEANEHSDLDLFIMDSLPGPDTAPQRRLTSLEQAHLLSTIDRARHAVGFRPFSQGGRYLACHDFSEMANAIGGSEDDVTNRLTARMLLLLNSRPLVNEPAYTLARDVTLDRYWRQESDAEVQFHPVFLINDIRRWWSVLLLNFEFLNPPAAAGDESAEARKRRAKRRLNNLKLRYARLLAAYTPILGLLNIAEPGGIRRSRASSVLDPPPLERLEAIRTSATDTRTLRLTEELIGMYDQYLNFMSGTEVDLYDRVLAADWREEIKARAYHFGDVVKTLMQHLGEGSSVYRYVVV